jgi:hypothetical protein
VAPITLLLPIVTNNSVQANISNDEDYLWHPQNHYIICFQMEKKYKGENDVFEFQNQSKQGV